MSTGLGLGGRAVRLAGVVAGLIAAGVGGGRAWAGGFEAPGIGVEAMGRGGAFTAKADDGTALEYNIAGLARQRGTRLTLEGKLVLNDHSFQRAGAYPVGEGNDAFAGMPYPKISNTHGVSGAPLLALSSDFGIFDRWTFAIGVTTPSASDADRTFPSTVAGAPAPQRYDLINANLFIFYPMVAAAVRVTKWFDMGLALQMVYGRIDLKAVAYADVGCTGAEATSCDAPLRITTTGFTATGALGLMFHPLRSLHIGLNLRGPIILNTSGDVTAEAPTKLPIALDPGSEANPAKGTLPLTFPWVLRLGIRYAFMQADRELGDIEVDGTYESWSQAQNPGDNLSVPSLGPFSDIKANLTHNYKDTGSVRVGGAYNLWFQNHSVLTLRLGVFYDSSATEPKDTRVDFDTLAKIGATLGAGFRTHGVTINAAYAYIYSPDRTVSDGNQHIINGTTGSTTGANGQPLPVYNNGTYHAATQLVLLGLKFQFDELLHRKRVLKYD